MSMYVGKVGAEIMEKVWWISDRELPSNHICTEKWYTYLYIYIHICIYVYVYKHIFIFIHI
jgi:hypothetical protein